MGAGPARRPKPGPTRIPPTVRRAFGTATAIHATAALRVPAAQSHEVWPRPAMPRARASPGCAPRTRNARIGELCPSRSGLSGSLVRRSTAAPAEAANVPAPERPHDDRVRSVLGPWPASPAGASSVRHRDACPPQCGAQQSTGRPRPRRRPIRGGRCRALEQRTGRRVPLPEASSQRPVPGRARTIRGSAFARLVREWTRRNEKAVTVQSSGPMAGIPCCAANLAGMDRAEAEAIYDSGREACVAVHS